MNTHMDEILEAILKAVDDVNLQLPMNGRTERSKAAKLSGDDGKLDSLGLINLIVAVERSVESHLGWNVVLTGDSTMSQAESVFASVNSLVEHVEKLLKEKEVG